MSVDAELPGSACCDQRRRLKIDVGGSMSMSDAVTGARAAQPGAQPGARAWFVLAILCFVYVLNFIDRQLVSTLAKPIQDALHVTDTQLGLITGLYFGLFYC